MDLRGRVRRGSGYEWVGGAVGMSVWVGQSGDEQVVRGSGTRRETWHHSSSRLCMLPSRHTSPALACPAHPVFPQPRWLSALTGTRSGCFFTTVTSAAKAAAQDCGGVESTATVRQAAHTPRLEAALSSDRCMWSLPTTGSQAPMRPHLHLVDERAQHIRVVQQRAVLLGGGGGGCAHHLLPRGLWRTSRQFGLGLV